PGERCRPGGSTRTKSSAAKYPRIAASIRLRASSSGRRSACTAGVHHGETGGAEGAAGKAGLDPRDWRFASNCVIGQRTRNQRGRPGFCAAPLGRPHRSNKEEIMVKVIASSLRKGNVVEQDGKLYVVLTAENIHPGKGASVTQV